MNSRSISLALTVALFANVALADLTPLNTPVSTAPDSQREPAIATDAAGGAIIAWIDRRNGVDFDIFARRVSATGAALWAADGVPICTASGVQQVISMAPDGSGGAFIVWEDMRTNNFDVYAQRINSSGIIQWSSNGMKVAGGNGDQVEARVVSDGVGGAIVAWTDEPMNQDAQVVAQRLDGAGRSLWQKKGVTLCNAPGGQFLSTLCPDGSGGAIAAWLDQRVPSFSGDVFGQRVSASGQTLWTTNGVALSSTGYADVIRVVEDGSGGALFAWTDVLQADLFARHVSGTGVLQGLITLCDAPESQVLSGAISDGTGGCFLVWDDNRDGAGSGGNQTQDIYAQHLSATDAPLWTPNGVPVTQAGGGQFVARMALDGAGGAWFAWQSAPFQGQGQDGIQAQHLDASGSPAGAPDTVATTPIAQNVAITTNGSGGVVVAWQDFRSGVNFDIYAQVLPPPSMATSAPAQRVAAFSTPPRPTSSSIRTISPNPARRQAGIDFLLPKAASMRLVVRDLQGRTLRVLHEGLAEPGPHRIEFDLHDKFGNALPTGVYLIELRSEGVRSVQRLAVIR